MKKRKKKEARLHRIITRLLFLFNEIAVIYYAVIVVPSDSAGFLLVSLITRSIHDRTYLIDNDCTIMCQSRVIYSCIFSLIDIFCGLLINEK